MQEVSAAYILLSERGRLTKLASALATSLETGQFPVYSDFQLFVEFRRVYEKPEGLYLRQKEPSIAAFRRTKNNLLDANVLGHDPDYPRVVRCLSKQDLPAEEVCCLIDPFCYISHISAMQRYGLTERRPDQLYLTVPAVKIISEMQKLKMEAQYFETLSLGGEFLQMTRINHPSVVRKRKLNVFETSIYGDVQSVRGTFARISTIGQTFVDMLLEPHLCGGMAHVRDVWEKHTKTYLEHITKSVNRNTRPIVKVRAGYLLDEVLKIRIPEMDEWQRHAQRGGSRVLDPTKPYKNTYSEKWMLSINV
ncbi:MAG: hypothetical protein CMQ34_05640 [Gammaproteobacteria bacterium]|nr:hypothetical protein [Gammaproteobacteria bacterium]|tara:strand:+ start:5033 stop:5953 length:921 start_codon:yes stop_codon:yes gene_type:complete